MRALRFVPAVVCGLAALFSYPAFAADIPALTGQVSSAEEGLMEGVLVSARKADSPVTVTVVSNNEGRYSFPAATLTPGAYTLSIRAVGYDLASPPTATVTAKKTATADLKLEKTKDLAAQLTNAEWIASVPGTEQQKSLLLSCVGCHTLERPLYSSHSPDEFVDVLRRMAGYAQVSQPTKPQKKVYAPAANAPAERFMPQAKWLASVNLSEGSTWKYPLKTFPRPTGRATHVVITEYTLPREEIQPHDVIVDAKGTVWFSEFSEEFVGSLDQKTGKVKEYALPRLKPDPQPEGSLALRADPKGDLWVGMMFQGAVARFDRATHQVKVWNLPADRNTDGTQINMVSPEHSNVDGKVWLQDTGKLEAAHRLDLKTGTFETFEPFKNAPPDAPFSGPQHVLYDVVPDSHNNAYFTDLLNQVIGRIDAKTGKVSLWRTPTANSNTRRGSVDHQDRFWFAEHRGNRIGMFDPKIERVQEWEAPIPWSAPYDVAVDKNGDAWTGGMTSDRILRLNPATGEFVAYLLPRETNVRRVFVDSRARRPTFWVGSNHGASIVKLEPLD
jgi:virginiamycin B lyase